MPNYPISALRRLTALSASPSTFLLLGAVGISPAFVHRLDNPSHPDSASAVATVAQFRSALATSDTVAALSLLAPDVVILESGDVETLRDYRAHHMAADMEFARAVRGTRSPSRATVQGGVAWVSSTSSVKGTFRGRPIDSAGAELMVLTKRGTAWKIRAIHWSSRSRLTGVDEWKLSNDPSAN